MPWLLTAYQKFKLDSVTRLCLTPLQVMFQLQRGPMLGGIVGHSDERALLHATFLAATAPTALLMIAPQLYLQSADTASFTQMPALDLALQPGGLLNNIMSLQTYTHRDRVIVQPILDPFEPSLNPLKL